MIMQYGVIAAMHGRFHVRPSEPVPKASAVRSLVAQTDNDCPVCTIASVHQICSVPSAAMPAIQHPPALIPTLSESPLRSISIVRRSRSPPLA